MNSIRKWTWVLAASAFAAFAWPAIAAKPPQAQDKSYSVEFLIPPTVNGNPNPYILNGVLQLPVTVTVYVKNESPPTTAASNASSVRFALSGLVPVGVACPRALCTVDTTTGAVFVTNISQPIQAKEVYPITLQVNSCAVLGDATIRDVHVNTGSQFNGAEFSQYLADTSFPVQLTLSTRDPFAFPTVPPFPTIAPTGISCGSAPCNLDVTVPNNFSDTAGTSVIRILRLPNADASCSASTSFDYFVTNNLWSSNTLDPLFRRLHASWSAPGISPVFAYELTRATAASGWEVGWLPKPGTAVTIPAPVCFPGLLDSSTEPNIADLPSPEFVGLLSQDLKANANKVKVDTLGNPPPTVPAGGLPIRIEGEWMLLTDTSSTGWDVTRIASLRTSHLTGTTVATTPMQLLSGLISPLTNTYTNGLPAQMCMAWQSTDTLKAWILDGNDGWVLGR